MKKTSVIPVKKLTIKKTTFPGTLRLLDTGAALPGPRRPGVTQTTEHILVP